VRFVNEVLRKNSDLAKNKELMNELGIKISVLEDISTNCQLLLNVLKPQEIEGSQTKVPRLPLKSITAKNSSESIGTCRVIFTLALILIIYAIFTYDIQFADIRDFMKYFRKQYEL